MRFGINVFVFLLVVLFGNVASAGVNLPLEKNMKCQNKSHDYIKGYKVDVTETEILIFLCDGGIISADKLDKGGIRHPIISKNKKSVGWVTSVLYPADDRLKIYEEGKIYVIPHHIISPDWGAILSWKFSSQSKVIIQSGFQDENEATNFEEFDIKTGRKIKGWHKLWQDQ